MMRITTAAIHHAILAVFLDERVAPGGWISLPDLQESWSRTGFRSSDLDSGIRTLVGAGDLSPRIESVGGAATLTPDGYRRANSMRMQLGALRANAIRWPNALWGRLVSKTGPVPGGRLRRSGDRPSLA